MIINFIAYYMKHVIDLFILFPHTLHFFQPLNVNVFAFLKYILIKKIMQSLDIILDIFHK